MQCDEVRPRLEAYVDGELAEAERVQLRDHLADCPECGPEATALEHLRDGIRQSAPVYRAPEALRSEIRFALRRQAATSARGARPAPGWLAYAASILLAVAVGSGGTLLITGERQEDAVANELIDSHLRSLLGNHLTDVASSDQHTVKPWFAGRSELSPPAVDLAGEGFPLVGGRLDLIAGKPIPALVYRRREHVVNVFVLPASRGDLAKTLTRRGYSLRHWDEGDLGFWAVTDAAPSELAEFERVFRDATKG
ncbi:MAG TPA: anti-sigma factor [Stellaceae bacterium]|jgi:mycothiol system anti-sigma-R factor|nr:anti-sigma factor [Stellaceae bacterium]